MNAETALERTCICLAWQYADAIVGYRKMGKGSGVNGHWYHGLLTARRIAIGCALQFAPAQTRKLAGAEMRRWFKLTSGGGEK